MAVVTSTLQITTTSLPNAIANQGYTAQLQAIGGSGNYTWSLVESTLPQGILLDPATGALTGIAPNVNGIFPFTVQVADQAAQLTANQTFNLNVVQNSTPTLSITTTSLPNATLSVPYSFQLQGTGPATAIWSLQPTGLTPSLFSISQSGILSGFPSVLGKFSITAQLTDGAVAGAPSTVIRTFPLNITLGPLSIQEVTLPGATQSAPYTVTLTPVGGLPPYTWSIDPANSASLTIDPNTGTLSGTPPNAGSFDVRVTLTDATGAFFSQVYSLKCSMASKWTMPTLP